MRVYFDNCALNRSFDDQKNNQVKIESEAVAKILEMVRSHSIELVWSSTIDYENGLSKVSERRESVAQWKSYAVADIFVTEKVSELSSKLLESGLGKMDSLHIASAVEGSADYFVTTDRGIVKRRDKVRELKILNPLELLGIIEK